MFKYNESGVDYSEDYKDAALRLMKAAMDTITNNWDRAIQKLDLGPSISLDTEDPEGSVNFLKYQLDLWENSTKLTEKYISNMYFFSTRIDMLMKIIEESYDTKGMSSDFLKERYNRCCKNIKDILDVELSNRTVSQGPFVAFTTLCFLAKLAEMTVINRSRVPLSYQSQISDFLVPREELEVLRKTVESFLKVVG